MIILRKPGKRITTVIIADDLSGVTNGSNQTYTTTYAYKTHRISVVYNGQTLHEPDDFTEISNNTITLTHVFPDDTDELRANYELEETIQPGSEHGDLVGLLDDDHPQYHNNARGDARYFTKPEIITISGSLQDQIDDKSDIGHLHDDRYYTETEVDTISGSLQDQIDDKSDIGHTHTESDVVDLDKYTQAEVDALWATWSGTIDHDTIINTHNLTTDIDHDQLTNYTIVKHRVINDTGASSTDLWSAEKILSALTTISGLLDDHNELNNIQGGAVNDYYHLTYVQYTDLTDSGDCSIHKHDDRYYTETETDDLLTTLSGNLQDNIDDKSDICHLHDDRYYTETEVDTISGSLQDQIDEKPDTFLELDDTLTSYSGSAGEYVRVKDDISGLYFAPAIVGVTSSGTNPPDPDETNLWYNTTLNEFFYYDYTRGNWLSIVTHNYLFSYFGNIDGLYLSIGEVKHSYAHYPIPRASTITSIIAVSEYGRDNSAKGFDIIDDTNTLFSFNLSNWSYEDVSANVDIDAAGKLKVFCSATGDRTRHPLVTLEVKRRYEAS